MARRKPPPPEKRRPQKKKVSILNSESITYVDYKDVDLLRRFMSERAKIRARRVTGNSAQQQRQVARAIRVAREMALLPYAVRQVTTRRSGRRDRDARPEQARPTEVSDTPPPPPTSVASEPDADTSVAESTEAAPEPRAEAEPEASVATPEADTE